MRELRRPSVEGAITFGVVAAAVLFVFSQLQPSLIFANTTPSGGDMGAHVWGPAFMRDHLIPNLRLSGWAPDWYAGFPAYHFYFPLPALAIVILDVLLPYGIAFKIVSVLGLLSLPVAAWAFGRLSGMRFPGPAMLAVATVPFLFDRGFTIYGGNIASTLAGEFSFSISLSLALVFLGVVARGLDTGRDRALAAVLLALTGLSHLLPTVFAVVGALILLLLRPGKRRAAYVGVVFAIGAALAAFWSLPFLWRMAYANNMGWEKITQYSKNLFPHNLRWLVALAALGVIASVAYRRRTGLFFFGMAAVSGAVFVVAPEGRLWNARALPFWYLCLYLLAGVALAEGAVLMARLFAADPLQPSTNMLRASPVVAGFMVYMLVGLPLHVLPGWLPKPASADTSYIPSWARWNYSGYERKDAYPEYRAVINTMAEVGRTHGCGRAHWEYEAAHDKFGTPMAFMLLPYWTDSCIGSMEGLYFESSATVPYHFLSAGELSKAPSNPMRDLPYKALDLKAGVEHLKLLGSKYYLAFSPEAVTQAQTNPDLRLIAETGRWKVFEVRGSELVTPLSYLPAVVTGVSKGERPWLDLSVNWYMDPNAHEVPLAASGPKEWPRVELHDVPSTAITVGSSVAVDTPPRVPVPPATVTNIKATDNSLSFDVDRVGTPVLVKASYFPNWKVKGANGPWRVTPNLMVVVPTSNHVSFHYGRTPIDILGLLLTIGAIAATVAVARRGPAEIEDEPRETPAPLAEGRDKPVDDADGDEPVRQPVTVRHRGP